MVQRIASLASNVSMLLYALTESERIVARTGLCLDAIDQYRTSVPGHDIDGIHRVAWERAAIVGSWTAIDLQALLDCDPDLVITSGSCLQYDPRSFRADGLRVEHLNVSRLCEMPEAIVRVGAWIGREPLASRLADAFLAGMKRAMPPKLGRIPPPRVYHEKCICPVPEHGTVPARRMLTCGHGSPEVITLAGGFSGLVGPGDESRWCRSEDIIAYDPEVILLNRCSSCPVQQREHLTERPGWGHVSAVVNGRVFEISANVGNVNLLAAQTLAEVASVMHRRIDAAH